MRGAASRCGRLLASGGTGFSDAQSREEGPRRGSDRQPSAGNSQPRPPRDAYSVVDMADLYLNAIRVTVEQGPGTVIGRVWDRDDDIDAQLREDPARGTGFAFRSYNELTYAW